jgi:hypothetical protein
LDGFLPHIVQSFCGGLRKLSAVRSARRFLSEQTMNSQQFIYTNPVRKYAKSREIGSSQLVDIGAQSVHVACACGHTWTATEGNGLLNVVGGQHITCPACKASELTQVRTLKPAA